MSARLRATPRGHSTVAMRQLFVAAAAVAVLGLSTAAREGQTPAAPAPRAQAPATPAPVAKAPSARPAAAPAPMVAAEQTRLVTTYCATCHSDRGKAGGVSFASFDAMKAHEQPEVIEKMIRKLRAGMMPPPGAKRPDAAQIDALAGALEARMDEFAASHPNPGWRPFQRLTRAEYSQAVKDLLDLEVDVTPYLPADTQAHGFDNIAEAQAFSPALLDGYLRAASQVSRLALGDKQASPTAATYRVLQVESQMRYVEGTPLGSRGGIAVVHNFPADGDYKFTALLQRTISGELFGNTGIAMAGSNELLEVSINGERAAVLEVKPSMSDVFERGFEIDSPLVHVKAGPQRIAAAFVPRFVGPVDDLMMPIDHTLVDMRIGTGFGITSAPHIQDLVIAGPMKVTGISDTPSRRKVFTCRPTTAEEERTCATDTVRRLATQAFRGPVGAADMADLMKFYDQGRQGGDFESGIRLAIQGILANPRFLFRVEQQPETLPAGGSYRITDLELASRLSFFIWGTVPDPELIKAATAGTFKTTAGLERQVRRMLADPKAEALATRFGAQWLRLQDVEKVRPDGILYPQWDQSLTESMREETERFFASLVQDDRSVLDLLNADYTFLNERLSRHYGFGNVTGPEFRRVALPPTRRGVLTQGSVLMMTSVADRTSPVQRGKWVMQVMLGSPPPPPPPNVPALEETGGSKDGKVLSVRERMEEHRKNPACTSCHRVIDPLGLALEHFDVTGQYRIKDNGVPVDATGTLYDGSQMEGADGLRLALLKYKDAMLASFTESLMTYALGRHVEAFDMATVRAIQRDAARQDYKISAFVQGVVKSPAFRMSRPGPADTTAAADRQ
jgi:mono/diheme cytochrome c family protein